MPGKEVNSLQSLSIMQALGNPEVPVPAADLIGLVVGGLLGWWIVRKNTGMAKYAGVIIGAELGIMVTRRFIRPANIS